MIIEYIYSSTALQLIKRWKSLETTDCSFFGALLRCGCVDIKSNSFSFFEFEGMAEAVGPPLAVLDDSRSRSAGDGGRWAVL